jgi:hypothetical protein
MGALWPELAETGTAALEYATATSRRSCMGIANGSRRPETAIDQPARRSRNRTFGIFGRRRLGAQGSHSVRSCGCFRPDITSVLRSIGGVVKERMVMDMAAELLSPRSIEHVSYARCPNEVEFSFSSGS